MLDIYTAEDIRTAEAPYINAPGYNGYLMARAAKALAKETHAYLKKRYKHRAPENTHLLLLVGPGNNGADTIWAGKRLAKKGYRIDLLLTDPEGQNLTLAAAESMDGTRIIGAEWEQAFSCEALQHYQLIIDGVLGTGARGAARGVAGRLLEKLRALQVQGMLPPVIACDMPTGIDAHSGTLHEPCLRAERTVTFIGRKLPAGTALEAACGEIKLHDLGIPEALNDFFPALIVPEREDHAQVLSLPNEKSHKYTRGVLGVLAGSDEYPGAGVLTTRAAINTGVGMVRYGYPSREVRSLVLSSCPEAVTFDASESRGHIPVQHVDACTIGSGVNFSNATLRMLQDVLESDTPAVLDAGALDLVAAYLAHSSNPLGIEKILTPHAGELARFLNIFASENPTRWNALHASSLMHNPLRTGATVPSREDIEAEPYYWVRAAAWISGATVMLKGGTTLIATGPQANIYDPARVHELTILPVVSVPGATPWLATAGSGDTLSGILGALLAQVAAEVESFSRTLNYSPSLPSRIAALAVYLHGQAALESLQGAQGPVPATRVAEYLPRAIAQLITEL